MKSQKSQLKKRGETSLDGTFFENETAGRHDLLVCAGDVEVPSLCLFDRETGDMAAVDLHCCDDELLDGVSIGYECVWEGIGGVLEGERLGGVVEGSRRGRDMARGTRVGEGERVNIHDGGGYLERKGY
jgi:hypothetical protein